MAMQSRLRIRHAEGQVLVLTTVALVVLVGMSALTIDLGMAYSVKAKLTSAVDAAVLAAGKAVKVGADDATRRLNATNAANNFFAANFPTGIRGTTSTSFGVDSITNVEGTWTIKASARTRAPTFFSGMINVPIMVGASAESTVKTLDMMLVLDCSGSLGSDFPDLQDAAVNFVGGFQEGTGGDRIGLVTFASGAVLSEPVNKDSNRGFNRSRVVGALNATSMGGATNAEEALRIAKTELDLIPSDLRSTLRVIVFFSDGAPNVVSADFVDSGTVRRGGLYSVTDGRSKPYQLFTINRSTSTQVEYTNILTIPATDYTGTVSLASFNAARTLSGSPVTNTWCNLNKSARNMVENIANAARSETGTAAITLFSIGLGERVKSNEVTNCSYDSSEYGENILKRIANTKDSDRYQSSQPSGIYVWAADGSQLNSAFQRVRSAVLRLNK